MNKADLVPGLKNLLHRPELQGAVCSLVVKDDKNHTLLSYNPGLFLVPASNTKLITTATAYEVLGPEYRFETKVYYTGAISGNKISGDLIIKGFADPTVGSEYFDETSPKSCFEKILALLKEKNVNEIEGNIVIDRTYIPNHLPYVNWSLEDYPYYYGAVPQGFNFMDNAFTVKQNGHRIVVKEIPGIDTKLLMDECEVFEDNTIEELEAIGSPACSKKQVYVNPDYDPAKYKDQKLSLANPGLIFRDGLISYLKANNVKINVKGTSNSERHEIGTLKSPPLSEVIKMTNFNSINLFAECIYIALLKAFEGKKEQLNEHWKNSIGNSKFNICDGSGLARKNIVTADFLADVLMYMYLKKNVFLSSLPLLGKEGTAKSYCRDIQGKNEVRFKTGSMGNVRAFAGIVKGTETLSFSMIFNNYQCTDGEIKKLSEEMLKAFAMA